MNVTFLLYDQMTALDLVGPYQVLSAAPGVAVQLAARSIGPVLTDSGMRISSDSSIEDISTTDIVVVPGSSKPESAIGDPVLIQWLQRIHPLARWTTSVCTGSLILGAAGILRGRKATTHWLAIDGLGAFGAEAVEERVVIDGTVVTAAGVSAGIDMALTLVGKIWGETTAKSIQLAIEYDPDPPYKGGSKRSASPETIEAATRGLMAGRSA